MIDNNHIENQDNNIIQNELELPKQQKKRVKNKEKIFKTQRKEILDKILLITGMTFHTHEIDTNLNKQTEILELEPQIKQYFNVSNWSAFKNTKQLGDGKRPISIVKSVLKDMGIEYQNKSYVLKQDRGFVNTTEYVIKQ